MAREDIELRPGKGAAFDKGRLKRVRQEDETWEADFRALPKPMMQNETHYLGLVVTKRGGSVLADTDIVGRPSANDLAALLGKAMRQPLADGARRPTRLHVRGHRQWRELLPHLEELGVKVSVTQELPKFRAAYGERLRQIQEARRGKMVRPTEEQQGVEGLKSMVTFRRRHFDDKVSNPRGVGIYYRCDICGAMLYSYSPHAVACSCRNLVLDVDAGRISAKDPNKVSIMEKVGGKGLKRWTTQQMKTISINRAPVLALWAAVVAQRLGFDEHEALTLAKAVAGLNAQRKGRRLGIFKPHEDKAKKAREKERGEAFRIDLCGRAVPATNTDEGIRAVQKGKPVDPDSVRRYLEDKFGDDLKAVRSAMTKLARAYKPQELAEQAYTLYEQFRPSVRAGVPKATSTWG